ncbi:MULTISPECIES: helix-turn-helix domain-containing protein [Paenibacillus]|uniref:Ribosome-binding protein aMBF1 (Putative translation factor) n=1 Tax=Paenibacillus lactis TaxID=228574 RepID=A0ABS4F538_9BACL|nr:helix-turn-helix domain-containing protein [Paenibacillus lactis]MBP1891371.1 ribosome-binding protein aMBF1 (putative translation factor) [Paenibacillus lactis]MCM3493809.1 helix-turn-helix domain-containing protein [Paenibacillus lactis]HAF98257.1 transcriptional regulator [Paenibacillus lactis]
MDDLMRMVGEGIRHFRRQRGLSQEELASKAEVHETYIGKLERSEKVCSVVVLAKITNALDLSMVEFFSYIQPVSGEERESTLTEIVDRLRSRSEAEQKRILKVIDVMLDDQLS